MAFRSKGWAGLPHLISFGGRTWMRIRVRSRITDTGAIFNPSTILTITYFSVSECENSVKAESLPASPFDYASYLVCFAQRTALLFLCLSLRPSLANISSPSVPHNAVHHSLLPLLRPYPVRSVAHKSLPQQPSMRRVLHPCEIVCPERHL